MVYHCANATCGKPLHYLHEGKIFVFDLPDLPSSAREGMRAVRRLQHFWLCAECSDTLMMVQTDDSQIQVKVKLGSIAAGKAALPSRRG